MRGVNKWLIMALYQITLNDKESLMVTRIKSREGSRGEKIKALINGCLSRP
jgi:hypothetical protein